LNVRLGLGLATLLAVGVAPALPASAAKVVPSCNIITDGAGDAAQDVGGQPVGPSSDAIDILSGDLGSGARNVVAVLRLKSLAVDTLTTPGATYGMTWTVNGAPQQVLLTRYSDGTGAATFKSDTSFGSNVSAIPVGYGLDPALNTVTWYVPRRIVPQLKKKGAKFVGLDATARPAANLSLPTGSTSATFLSGDTAGSPRTYVDRAATCVKGI
jgi:hypothetical protein